MGYRISIQNCLTRTISQRNAKLYFSKEELERIQAEFQTIRSKHLNLREAYTSRDYDNARAEEYAKQGFSRRLKTLTRSIENTFEILPPDRNDLPTNEELTDAAINIQAFVFNIFGSVDNLAWIWVSEKGLKKEDGSPIPNSWVGLGKKNELVRESFSEEFRIYLEGLNDWFDHLEDFRHALAHRIPLYIPPYVVSDKDEETYRDLETRMWEALKSGLLEEHERLSVEQMAMCEFRPWITHSFEENAKQVVFHCRLLLDFNAVEELGQKMLEELSR